MLQVRNSNITIPNITHADAYLDEYNYVMLTMNSGYVFWDKRDYTYNGVYEEPAPEDICYSRSGMFPQNWDFAGVMEAVESEVPSNQIFGKNNEETI